MQPPSEENSRYLGQTEPLSEQEVREVSAALYKLAIDGTAFPKHLLRHAYTGDLRTSRLYGHTLDAIPPALDRLGEDRETAVVGLIKRFEQAVRNHHDQVTNRSTGVPLDQKIMVRYFDVVYLVGAAKPKTEKSVIQVADFLRSEKQEVHEKASEMLQGAPYFPVIIDRLFENVATHGICQWPNRQSRTLASFAYVPEVRLRLMNCFHSEEENLRYLAVMAFSYLGENAGADAEAELFAIAESDEDRLQAAALGGLSVIVPLSERPRQLALRLIHSDKYWVRGTAIACLEGFRDHESIDALLTALLDEGGPDYDNAIRTAKMLEKMSLDPNHVLEPIMAALRILLEREDKVYEERGAYADWEPLLAVARVLGRLGTGAIPAVPLIENCSARPYVAGASDGEEWRKILERIKNCG
jgi:hypothetical protein